MDEVKRRVDAELDARDSTDPEVALLLPEDWWEPFIAAEGLTPQGDPPEITYRGVRFRKGPVTAIIAEEGF